jgi:hypothetical protein
MLPFVLALVWLVFAITFVRKLYVEAKQTSWDLLEALIAANILGNVVAIPVAWALSDSGYGGNDTRLIEILTTGLAATVVAACMAGGAIWTFRRLKIIGETRRWPRLGWMMLGLLLFPSMLAFPWNMLAGWFIWLPLRGLHQEATRVSLRQSVLEARRKREALKREAAGAQHG